MNDYIAKCFISYCHDDVSLRTINNIVEQLRSAAKGRIIFYFDEDNGSGTQLREYMDNINNCDSVIIVCSPKYKKKANIDNENIAYEFNIIKEKYRILLEMKKEIEVEIADVNFGVYPIIISDIEKEKITSTDAYPDFLQENKIVYKRYTYVSDKIRDEIKVINNLSGNKKSIRAKQLLNYKDNIKDIDIDNNKVIKNIVSKTLAIKLSRSITIYDQNTKIHRLITYTKAEINGNLGPVFCRTKFYKELQNQVKNVFIGRKGSGKSQSILQFINEKKDDYKGIIRIDANYINIESIFAEIIDLYQIENNEKIEQYNIKNINGTKNDIEDLFTYEELLRYVWQGYIYLYSIYIIATEDEQGNISQYQKNNFKQAKVFINKILNKISKENRWENRIEVSTALYEYAFYSCIKFYGEIIEKSRTSSEARMFADLRAANSLDNYLVLLLGKQCKLSFERTITNCTKKIFLSLDGFDNIQSEKRGERIRFVNNSQDKMIVDKLESVWLTTLLDVIYSIKTSSIGDNILKERLDICLMVPFDRYMQSTLYKRDGFVYRELMTSAIYKGLDLCRIFTKRLQIIADVEIENDITLPSNKILENLNKVLNKFENLNTNVKIILKNQQSVDYPLFLLILRYTFWRPRDIIDHIASVFNMVINGEDLMIEIDSDMILESIAISSEKIVKKIIEEFKDLWINIVECLGKLYFNEIIMTYSEFELFIKEKSFLIQLSNGEILSNIKDIIKFLYKIGFIGIILDKQNMKKNRTTYKQHQVFYSGFKVLSNIGEESFEKNMIYFNPVFVSKYHLTINTDEILGINKWDELVNRDMYLECDYLNDEL